MERWVWGEGVSYGGGLPLRDAEMDCCRVDCCVLGGWFFSSGSGKLSVLATLSHVQVRPPCNYIANAMSLWYGPCGKDATGVNFVNHGVQQNWQVREWGISQIGMAGAHNFGCVRGTKKFFLFF